MSLAQRAKKNGQNTMELIKKLRTGGPPEEIIKLLLGEDAIERAKEVKDTIAPKHTIFSSVALKPELASVGSGYS